jgi:hypothetical protein
MRKFINIIENVTSFIPDPKSFVTDELINRIISTWKFVPHSSEDSMYEWYEEAVREGLFPEEFEDIDLEAASKTAEFKEVFTNWLRNHRTGFVSSMMQGIGPDTRIYRSMYVPKVWIDGLGTKQPNPINLGIYWTNGRPHSYAVTMYSHENDVEIILSTSMDSVTVDWQHTFESRFDWINGDEEEEIQLVQSSPIHNIEITYPDGSPIVVDRSNTFIA